MIQKQFYKLYNASFLFTIYFIIIGIVNGEIFAPEPIQPVQWAESRTEFFIKGNLRVYHKLEDSLTYVNILDRSEVDVNNNQDQRLRVKFFVRASNMISSDAKLFNFGINIDNRMIEPFEPIDLEYEKSIDDDIIYNENIDISLPGRWFFDVDINPEMEQDNGIDFAIKHISNANRLRRNQDTIYVRLVTEIIQHKEFDKGDGSIETINNSLIHLVNAENRRKPFKYYGLNIRDKDNCKEHQFSIKGPLKVRVYTRPKEEKKDLEYSIKISEDGLLLGEYKIDKYNEQALGFIETDYFHFTVPKGKHFYTFFSDDNDKEIFIRLTKYRDAK